MGGQVSIEHFAERVFAKGAASSSGTDIDLLISLTQHTPKTLKGIYNKLFSRVNELGYQPKLHTVSINIRVNGYDVDLVPARRQDGYSQDHSLFRRRGSRVHAAAVRALAA